MGMKRRFKTVDYAQTLDLTVRLGDCLPPGHLARFVADSVAQLDLSALYAQYGQRGGEPYAPEVLLGLLLYGYATGVWSIAQIERATYEVMPFRFIAGNLHPATIRLRRFGVPSYRNSRTSSYRCSCSPRRWGYSSSARLA
jgi:transposase